MAELKIKADSGGGTVSFKGPATTTSNAAVQLTLPVDDGTANQYLKTDGSGALSWATVDTSIADDSIVEAKLDVSNAPTNGQFLQAQSGEGGGLKWAGADSSPYFNASTNAKQTFAANTVTKLTVGESVDSGGMFASDRFTPTVAGTYCLMASAGSDDSEKIAAELFIGKNGSTKINNEFARVLRQSDSEEEFHQSVIVTANGSGDYFELYGWYWLYSGSGDKGFLRKSFKGFRLGA